MFFLNRYKKYIINRKIDDLKRKNITIHDNLISKISFHFDELELILYFAIIDNIGIIVFKYTKFSDIYIFNKRHITPLVINYFTDRRLMTMSCMNFEDIIDGKSYYKFNFQWNKYKYKNSMRCITAPEYVMFENYNTQIVYYHPNDGLRYNIIYYCSDKFYRYYYDTFLYENRPIRGTLIVCDNLEYLSRDDLLSVIAVSEMLKPLGFSMTKKSCNRYSYRSTNYLGGPCNSDFVIHYTNIKTINNIVGTYVAYDFYLTKDGYKQNTSNPGYEYKIKYIKSV